MASENGKVAAAPTTREFRVTGGAHRDAVFALGDELLVIGADESCDIRLSDAGVAPRHAVLMRQGVAVAIRQLDGVVAIEGRAIGAAGSAPVKPGADITLGESGVKLQLIDSSPSRYPSRRPPERARDRRWPRPMVLALLSMIVLAGAGLATQKLNAARPTTTRVPDLPAVHAALQKLDLDRRVAVATTPYGVELSGVIERDSAVKLRSAIAALEVPVVNSVVSDEDLVEQVREVFRTHGFHAGVRYAGARRVIVENLDETHARVRRAAAHVRSDVPQLAALEFLPPGDAPPPENAPPLEDAAAARITVRIDGDAAWLAAGGARYFVGSVLPTGHTVRRITPRAVQVEHEGEISWRAF